MGRAGIALFCGALAFMLPGADHPRPSRSAAPHLTVFAAASLIAAFTELGDTLEHRQPGLKVAFNFAGSQQLALQIEQGAQADVFASADDQWMTSLRDSGMVAGEPHLFARNRLVAIVPSSNPARIDRLQDLARRGVKLVLAAEQVPAGRYARQALSRLSLADGFAADYRQRTLENVVSNEENVKAVVGKVQLGEADAGIVYVSDVTPEVARHVRRLEIPDASNVIATYPVAVLKRAPEPEAARAFVALLLSPIGQRVLTAHGFLAASAAS